ncbi:hypothetical protein ACFQ0Q_50680 [Streptomyces aureus]
MAGQQFEEVFDGLARRHEGVVLDGEGVDQSLVRPVVGSQRVQLLPCRRLDRGGQVTQRGGVVLQPQCGVAAGHVLAVIEFGEFPQQRVGGEFDCGTVGVRDRPRCGLGRLAGGHLGFDQLVRPLLESTGVPLELLVGGAFFRRLGVAAGCLGRMAGVGFRNGLVLLEEPGLPCLLEAEVHPRDLLGEQLGPGCVRGGQSFVLDGTILGLAGLRRARGAVEVEAVGLRSTLLCSAAQAAGELGPGLVAAEPGGARGQFCVVQQLAGHTVLLVCGGGFQHCGDQHPGGELVAFGGELFLDLSGLGACGIETQEQGAVSYFLVEQVGVVTGLLSFFGVRPSGLVARAVFPHGFFRAVDEFADFRGEFAQGGRGVAGGGGRRRVRVLASGNLLGGCPGGRGEVAVQQQLLAPADVLGVGAEGVTQIGEVIGVQRLAQHPFRELPAGGGLERLGRVSLVHVHRLLDSEEVRLQAEPAQVLLPLPWRFSISTCSVLSSASSRLSASWNAFIRSRRRPSANGSVARVVAALGCSE